MRALLRAAVLALLTLATSPALARAGYDGKETTPALALGSHPNWPAPSVEDVRSIADLIAAFDATLSAPQGGKLDRNRLRSLFLPDGRITILARSKPGAPADVVFVTPDQYADLSDRSTTRRGFFDRVIANGVERFGDMAHVYSAYESRYKASDAKPFARGIKSFELVHSGADWRIVEVFYGREHPGLSIPLAWLHDRTL